MNSNDIALIAMAIISGGTLIGIFLTKTPGFGRFSTSLLLLVLVLFASAAFVATGRLESQHFANVLFAVAGFAGGLVTTKE